MKKILTCTLLLNIIMGSVQAQRHTTLSQQADKKTPTAAQQPADLSEYEAKQFISGTDTLPYRMLLPKNYDNSKTYPLILFLHGAGERGNDNQSQLMHGGSLFLRDSIREKYPAIVVFPQCPQSSYWSNVQITQTADNKREFKFQADGDATTSMNLAMGLTHKILEEYPVKKDQVYVMGLSMGGMGTFEIVRRMPATFAAAVPICGGADTTTGKSLRKTAWWIFHGAKDDVVPPRYSEDMVKELYKYYDVDMDFTLYSNSKHDSWNMVFKEPALMQWLFSKQLK
jgi:predicted peptidase